MLIHIWGLGHAGVVCAACLAELGHDVTGIDINAERIAAINSGCCPFQEAGLPELVHEMVRLGRLRATDCAGGHASEADVSFICVGTPLDAEGGLATKHIETAAGAIAASLRGTSRFHTVVLRSSVPPGFTRGTLLPLMENASGLRAGTNFGLAMYPEFLREASALADFRKPPCSIFGALDQQTASVLASLCSAFGGDIFQTTIEEAEMIKLVNNAFHALKAGFANEIGRLCAAQAVDAKKIMELLCRDTRLNISPAYLRPGFAFGGSCLPKDVQALLSEGHRAGLALPILESVLPSNNRHLEGCLAAIQRTGARRIGILGVTFKPDTDDLRESPALRLVARLHGEGFDVLAYDPNAQPGTLCGGNREWIERNLPDYEKILLPNLEAVISASTLLVVTQWRPEFETLRSAPPCPVLDLTDPRCGWNNMRIGFASSPGREDR